MTHNRKQKLWLSLGVALACGLALVLIDSWVPVFGRFDRLNYDLLMQHRWKNPVVDGRLVFFMIDNQTTRSLQQYPLPRSAHARLLKGLAAVKAQRVVWDLIFDLPSPEDSHLAAAMRLTPTFLAVGAKPSDAEKSTVTEFDMEQLDLAGKFSVGPSMLPDNASTMPYVLTALAQKGLIDEAKGVGHVAAALDPDGVSRRVPIVVRVCGRLLPSLGLAAALDVLGVPRDDIGFDGQALRIGGRSLDRPILVPLDGRDQMYINYVANWTRQVDARPYAAQLASLENFPADMAAGLAGKTVLVGDCQSPGSDFVSTPLDQSLPGSMVIFNTINTILTRQFITPAPNGLVLVLTLMLPMALGAVYEFGRPLYAAAVGAILVFVLVASSAALFYRHNLFVPIACPVLATVLAWGALSVTAHLQEHVRARGLATLLARFVTPALLQEIQARGVAEPLPGVKRIELSVLSVDIAGFTAFADRAEPEEVSEFLALFYQTAMEELVNHKATLDKFTGDGLLAYFGAPEPVENKEHLAVATAVAIQERFRHISEDLVQHGKPQLRLRCGVASGRTTVGYFGGEKHATYTVVGRAVNLAARLQNHAEPGQILVDKQTAARLKGMVELQQLDAIQVRGIDRPVEVWFVPTKI
jgi:adenylate cyclase